MGASLKKIEYKDITFHEKLGEGGFGAVHHVTFKRSLKGKREGAAKTVFETSENEATIMGELSHPNIVTLFGVCQTGAITVILLEYALHGSLHDYLSDPSKPVTADLRKKWMKESALALQYLHSHNVLHRDIKPSNCLLFEEHLLKLSDFGLAKQITKSQTTSGYKGTCQYMAPEIHRGNENGKVVYSKPSDIYAYGMLILEMFTRHQPFDGLQWFSVVFYVGCGKQPDIPNDCQVEVANLMKRCWRDQPKGRPTIDAIVEELFNWRLVKTITPNDDNGGSFLVQQVACCPNGNIVAVENGIATSTYPFSQICILDRERGEQIRRQFQKRTNTVAVSKHGHIAQICKRVVNIFNEKLIHVRKFTVPTLNEYIIHRIICAKFDDENNRLVLCDKGQTIWVYSMSSGRLIEQFRMIPKIHTTSSQTMTLNGNNKILFHVHQDGDIYSKVIVIDYSGNEVFSFSPIIDEYLENKWVWAQGIVCDKYNNIYIGIRVMGSDHSGHIHKYSPEGKFLKCIVRGLYMIKKLDIAVDGSLVVADWQRVRIFQVQ